MNYDIWVPIQPWPHVPKQIHLCILKGVAQIGAISSSFSITLIKLFLGALVIPKFFYRRSLIVAWQPSIILVVLVERPQQNHARAFVLKQLSYLFDFLGKSF